MAAPERVESSTTVVIPTRDRPSALAACLEAISQQTIAEELDVVVVDDGSHDEAGVAAIVEGRPGVRLVRTAAAGPSTARNAGAAAARGQLILFTDDDCRPAADWAERLTEALRSGSDAVAGLTINGDSRNRVAAASQVIANALVMPVREHSLEVLFAPSNNLGCRIEIARSIPFDASFAAPGGEDRDWCAQLLRAGYSLRLESRAVVHHFQTLRLASFWRQQLRYGRGAARFRQRAGAGVPLEAPAFYMQLLRRGARSGMRVGLLVAAAQLATAVGFGLETVRSMRRPG